LTDGASAISPSLNSAIISGSYRKKGAPDDMGGEGGKMVRRLVWAAALGLILLSAVGAAQAQQKVVVYSANDSTLNDLAFAAFQKETGIAVETISTGSGVLFKRIQSEKDHPQGDIIWGVSRALLQSNTAYFAPYKSKNADAIPAQFRDPNDLWIGTNLHLLVILQNTAALPADQGPRRWTDLLDPKWRGKIAFTDPANSGSAFANIALLVEQWGGDAGWGKVRTLIANTKMLNRSSLIFQGVGQGEYPLGISLEYAGLLWAHDGAPVKTIYPEDGTLALMEGVAIIKGGPNTEAAKTFVDWINKKETREMILKATFRRPARQDLDLASLPGNMPPLDGLKLLSYEEDAWTARRAEALEKIKAIIEETR
jgi:iron(III) transport system substrate-binding protein